MKSSLWNSVVPKKKLSTLTKKAHQFTLKVKRLAKKNSYATPESSLFIGNDAVYQKAITKALVPFRGTKHVILIGIGGSSLGVEAIYRALAYVTSPKLHVLDSIDSKSLTEVAQLIETVDNPKDITVVVVSKSGTTTETMLNAGKVLELCEKKYGSVYSSRIIFIGNKATPFLKIAKKQKFVSLTIPDKIGGRYSVFSAVGMVPLTLLGIDVIALREGAHDALSSKALLEIEKNVSTLAFLTEQGMNSVNFFTFNSQLELCGLWYRQLLAESIGKNMTTKGATFSHQLLPIVSTSVDLHSMAQLYLGGFKNMYTHFIYFNEQNSYHTLAKQWLLEHVPFLSNKTSTEVKDAIKSGVLQAYDDQKLPYRYIELPACTAYEIGYLMNTCMCEVMCFAHMFDIDAFNQPNVESYKKHTRVILNS